MVLQIHQICDMIWKQRNESTQVMREGQPFERLLAVRGVKDWASFSAPMRHAEHDPFLMKDMDIAVELLQQYL